MKVKDLQPRQGKVDIKVEVSEKGDIREFEKSGEKGRVCSAKAKDTSGEIVLSLWNEQIEQVNVGDKIQITNGYVSEFQGEKQLTTGKFGKLEVLEKGEGKEEQPTVYTNAPAQIKDEMKELKEEKLPEEPVDDEEYIG